MFVLWLHNNMTFLSNAFCILLRFVSLTKLVVLAACYNELVSLCQFKEQARYA